MSQGSESGARLGDSSLLRRLNLAAALKAFVGTEALTLRELGSAVGVSRPTTEDLLAQLITDGRVEETSPPRQPARGAGRPARYYRFRAESGYVSGLDIGAHKTMAVLTDLRGRTLATRRTELDPDLSAEDRLAAAVGTARECWAEAGVGDGEISAVACGVTGTLHAPDGVRDVAAGPAGSALAPYSLPGFTEVDVAAELADALGRDVLVENDVKLAALAERWKGAAQDYDDIVYMFAGHRAGAGVLIGGQVHQGRHGAAGEIGVLPMLGWESVVARLHARGAELADGDPAGREGELVIASAARQDRRSLEVLIEFAEVLARGAAILALAVDPEVVVLGGGMSRGGAIVAEPFRRELARLTLVPVEVVTSTMGADSVALGAARLALDSVLKDLLAVPGW
jgi:predicted NBD/HSP70 family sugar kinase